MNGSIGIPPLVASFAPPETNTAFLIDGMTVEQSLLAVGSE